MAPIVLVVDDYPDARLLLSYVLEDAGFHVIYADTGPTAIAMAREHRPDAIVMDIHLPGMTGVDATRILRGDAALANVPIVAHTLSSYPINAEERALFDGIVGKRSPADSLVDVLRHAIRARSEPRD